MSTNTDSFDASRLGAFVASQFGDARNAGNGNGILIWGNGTAGLLSPGAIISLLNDQGYQDVHTHLSWSGNVEDYSIVVAMVQGLDDVHDVAEWLDQLSPTWSGGIFLITARSGGTWKGIYNTLANGLRVDDGEWDRVPYPGLLAYSYATPHDFGLPLYYYTTGLVTGGTPVYARNGIPGHVIWAFNPVGSVTWVLTGPSSGPSKYHILRFVRVVRNEPW